MASGVDIQALDTTFDKWVHTGRNITIKTCSPDCELAQTKLNAESVYPISGHVRGRAVLISNTGYHALRLLKDLFIQLNYRISIVTEKSVEKVQHIVESETQHEDNSSLDSFVIIIYGTPDGTGEDFIPSLLRSVNNPSLEGKPKLIYVIGDESIVKQVSEMHKINYGPDILLASTGFNGIMFYIYSLCMFVHELSAQHIWMVMLQFADHHKFLASTYMTLRKDFYFFPGLSGSDPASSEPYTKLSKIIYVDEKSSAAIPDIKDLEIQDSPGMSQEDNREYISTPGRVHEETMEVEANGNVGTVHKRMRTDSDHSDFSVLSQQSSVEGDFEYISNVSAASGDSQSLSDFEMPYTKPSVNIDSIKTARRVFERNRRGTETSRKEAIVSLWDFAGQFVYYATHQLFLSPCSLYLLVLNMEDDLDKSLEDWHFDLMGPKSLDTQGGVDFWVRSIFSYAKGPTPGIPPIFVVLTHKDKMEGSEVDKRKIAHKYFKDIKSIFHGSPIENNIKNEYFLLDNTLDADPDIEELKETVLAYSSRTHYWGEFLPAKWVELEQALDDRRREGIKLLSFKQLQEIDGRLASPIADSEQLALFLRVHHESGLLVYFGDQELRDIVILEPQWIVNAFRYLIRAKDFKIKYGTLQAQWEDFIETGRLEKSLAENIWLQDSENQFAEYMEILLKVLEKLNIISRACVFDERRLITSPLDFYYVPSLLKEKVPPSLLIPQIRKDSVCTPVLCFNFTERFLPPSVFNKVISVCLGRWPIACQGRRKLIYCGCAVFELSLTENSDRHRMCIFFRKSKIGMRITRYSKKGNTRVDPVTCDTVKRLVSSVIRTEFNRFHIDSHDPFEYQLQCRESSGHDVLDEGLHSLCDLEKESEIDRDFFCSSHSDMDEPHSCNVIDMLHEWFPEKVPDRFRLDGPSLIETWAGQLSAEVKAAVVSEKTMSQISSAIGKDWHSLMLEQFNINHVNIEQIEADFRGNVRRQIFECFMTWKTEQQRRNDIPTNDKMVRNLMQVGTTTVDWEKVQNTFDELDRII